MQPEFSRIALLEDITKKGYAENIQATPEECTAIAQRLGIKALEMLTANFTLQWLSDKNLQLTAHFKAVVEQECVRTLGCLKHTIEGEVEEPFTIDPPEMPEDEMDLETLLAQPESLEGEEIDVGEVIVQHLSLEINPFACDEASERVEHIEDEGEFPFGKLKDLKGE